MWGDALALAQHKVPFPHWLPGIIAVVAIVMINCIRREDLSNFDFDDSSFCR